MKIIKNRLRTYLAAKGIMPQNSFINCPWHEDKTPSCKINDDYVHCFGCGESGDIFKVAAALMGIPCDREHFREIASDVEKTLGLPEWQPPKRAGRSPNGFKLSKSIVYRSELLKEFAKAIDDDNLDLVYYRACLLLALFMLPDEKQEPKRPTLIERVAAYGIRSRNE